MRHLIPIVMLLLAALPVWASSVAKVSYLTGSTVYLDAGSSAGIAVGDTVEIWRDGELLGSLMVDYTSGRRSTCPLAGAGFVPRIDDEVRFTPGEVTPAAPPRRERDVVPTGSLWKGRIGLSYLGVRTRQDYGQDFDQPAGDLRLSGRRILGGDWNLEIDARGRRTYKRPVEGENQDYSRNRVYRASLEWVPGASGSGLVFGRQSSPELSNLSIFDGLSATLRRESWSMGLMGGTQPALDDFGFSSELLEFGAFYRRQSPQSQARRWSLSLAGIGSYREGEIDREYLYLQGSWSDPRFLVFASQELDLNRGWKQDYTDNTISPTASYVFGRYRLARALGFKAGFDNRQRIRLWYDRETPETEFDESYRQGYWVGADSRLGRSWYFALDFRGRTGGSAGSSEALSFRANWHDLRRFPVQVGARVTSFGNENFDGLLLALDLGWEATRDLRFDLEAGLREEEHTGFVQDEVDHQWLRLDTELALRTGWYWNLTGEWMRGGIDASDLYQSSLNYRF